MIDQLLIINMFYYHLRYNIYPLPGFPVEKEEWVGQLTHYNEIAMARILQKKYCTPISFIHFSAVTREAFFQHAQIEL